MTSEIKADPLAKARAAKAAKKAATIPAPTKPVDEMTPEELKQEHDRLQAALDALPFVGDKVKDQEPGTLIGEGLVREYVPHTRQWFEDVEERRKDRNFHNGKPAELKWPNYQLHDVFYQGPKPWFDISINGVTYTLLPGTSCKLPTPHYSKYMEYVTAGSANDKRFAQPDHPGTHAGYMHVNPQTGLAVILGKGALDKSENQ